MVIIYPDNILAIKRPTKVNGLYKFALFTFEISLFIQSQSKSRVCCGRMESEGFHGNSRMNYTNLAISGQVILGYKFPQPSLHLDDFLLKCGYFFNGDHY